MIGLVESPTSAKLACPVVSRRTASLKPHPAQARLFADATDAEMEVLVASIRAEGIREPLEILPDGTVIAGHQRLAAAKRLGMKEVPCRIRHDLAEQGPRAVEAYLIDDNFTRRQLSMLDVARCYGRLRQLQTGREHSLPPGDMRDHFAKRFNFSGRTLDRWTRLLTLPIAIQHAVSQHRLALVDAGRIVSLPADTQQKIAAAAHDRKALRKAVRDALRANAAPAKAPPSPIRSVMTHLKAAVELLTVEQAGHAALQATDTQVLQQAQKLIVVLQDTGRRQHEARQQVAQQLAPNLGHSGKRGAPSRPDIVSGSPR